MRLLYEAQSKGGVYALVAAMFSILAFFSSLFPGYVCYGAFFFAAVIVLFLFLTNSPLEFDLTSWGNLVLWLVPCCIAVVSCLVGSTLDLNASIAFVLIVLVMLSSAATTKWIKPCLLVTLFALAIFPISTIVLYLFPDLYTSFVKPHFFSMQSLAWDYRSGLTSHYSLNGSFCAYSCIASLTLFFTSPRNSKFRTLLGVLGIVSLLALLLTTKRTQLVVCVMVLALVFLRTGRRGKLFRIVGLLLFSAMFLVCVAPLLPGVEASLERVLGTFSSDSTVEESLSGRNLLWDFAVQGWFESPLLGHGWGSYYYVWPGGIVVSNIAHNEFLNLLYETGLLGAMFTTLACLLSLLMTTKLIIGGSVFARGYEQALWLSFAIQLYCLIYGFTTGSLFGGASTFYIYFMSIAIALAVRCGMSKNSCDSASLKTINNRRIWS